MNALERLRTSMALVAVVALGAAFGLGLSACGGDDDDDAASSAAARSEVAAPAEPNGGGNSGKGDKGGKTDGREDGADGRGANSPPSGAEGRSGSGSVDLTTDPGSIRGAIVTSTGTVQTVPPSPEAHDTAQKNSYSSIKAFGEEAEGEEATNITFALVQFLTAKAEADWATACARIYGPLRENLEGEGRGCPETFGALMSRVPQARLAEQAEIDVSSVRRGDGNRAFVIYKTPDTLSADMPMYVEDGVWKVGAVEAYALTPDQLR
ncbi:MAG TPA: hypothetical protein VHF50_01925 [Solirubrobacterales bacterium]|nr:hypothetical protein [Solirubrobacterales bacterium]